MGILNLRCRMSIKDNSVVVRKRIGPELRRRLFLHWLRNPLDETGFVNPFEFLVECFLKSSFSHHGVPHRAAHPRGLSLLLPLNRYWHEDVGVVKSWLKIFKSCSLGWRKRTVQDSWSTRVSRVKIRSRAEIEQCHVRSVSELPLGSDTKSHLSRFRSHSSYASLHSGPWCSKGISHYHNDKYQQYDSATEVYCSIRSPQNMKILDGDPRLRKFQAVVLVETRQAIPVRGTNFRFRH